MTGSTQHPDPGRPEAHDTNNQLQRQECGAEKLGGGRCTLKPVLGLQNCYQHAPELAEELPRASRAG